MKPKYEKTIMVRALQRLYDRIDGNKTRFVNQAIEHELDGNQEIKELRRIVFFMYENRYDPIAIHKLYWDMDKPPEVE